MMLETVTLVFALQSLDNAGGLTQNRDVRNRFLLPFGFALVLKLGFGSE